jgi:hypothetical protein
MRHISDILSEMAAKRYGKATPTQLKIIEDSLVAAERYYQGEIPLETAMAMTLGGYVRSQVQTMVLTDDPRYEAWKYLMNDIIEEVTSGVGMNTKHGFVAFSDVGDHTRGRVRHTPKGMLIEFQCPTLSGAWFWPSEVTKDQRYQYQQQRATSDDLQRQRNQWTAPEPDPTDEMDDTFEF